MKTVVLITSLTLCVASLSARAESKSEQAILAAADRFASSQVAALRPFFKALYIEGEHNAVLNFDYLGLAALEEGEFSVAERAFDAAIGRIETIYANNPNAKKAKSLFTEEKVKDFKGEPYERAMTYYYRGLLYVRAADYQNARASFLSAEQQSMMGESEDYQNTFGLMDYLAGWASYCDGDNERATEFGERAAKVQPDVFGGVSNKVDVVGLIDVGKGPSKYGIGKYKEKLAFKSGSDTSTISNVTLDGTTLTPPVLAADINWQATTRGGRPVDAILHGKAEWKSNIEGASSALTAAGYAATVQGAVSGNTNIEQAGQIGMIVGVMGDLFARAMTPAADTRYWSSLPAAVTMVTAPSSSQLKPMVFNLAGSDSSRSTLLNAQNGRCVLSWGRTESSSELKAQNILKPKMAESKRESVNQQFRSFLESTFQPSQAASAVVKGEVSIAHVEAP